MVRTIDKATINAAPTATVFGATAAGVTGNFPHAALLNSINGQYNARAFGAVGDGTTDNATAFAAISTFINALSGSYPVTVWFPDGNYLYTSGLAFTRPVTLAGGHEAILNYSGTGKAIKLGPDGLLVGTYHRYPYTVRGLTLTGGASMSHGIFFNKFITVCRVQGTYFDSFGNATAAGIWFEDENWDSLVAFCDFYSNSATAKNWIRVGATGFVNSTRLRVFECFGTVQGNGRGYGVWFDGANNALLSSKIEGFSPNVHVGALATTPRLRDSYFEVLDNNGCIRYGDITGGHSEASYSQGLIVDGCYCNLHHTDLSKTGRFIYSATANTGLQDCTLRNNVLAAVSASIPIVQQNAAKASQVRNVAEGNSGYTLLNDLVASGPWGGATNGLRGNGQVVAGAGQTVAALTETGNWGSSVFVNDTGLAVGNGGAVRFGTQDHWWAAIKGYAQSGSGNFTGDLVIAVRRATGDAALTESLRIKANGAFSINGGTDIKAIIAGTAAVDPPSIAAGAKGTATLTITGAAAGDVVMLNAPSALEAGLLVMGWYVSGADTVTIMLYNATSSPLDGASLTWTYEWHDLT